MKFKKLGVLVLAFLCHSVFAKDTERMLILVKRNYEAFPNEKATIVVDWREITKRMPSAARGIKITDGNFGKEVKAVLAARDNDLVDALLIEYVFPSNEPIFTFSITPSTEKNERTNVGFARNPKFEITFLIPSGGVNVAKSWPDKIIESTMQFYPDATKLFINAPGKWNYEMGVFLSAMFIQSQKKANDKYLQYVQRWADRFINTEGKIDAAFYDPKEYKLDDIIPGRPALFLYEKTKDTKYKSVAEQLMNQLEHQPKTSEGGYWHKEIYPHQMWLDGIYMADVFSVQFAKLFNQPKWNDEAIHQIKLIAKHTTDSKTGLMRHGWDESKNKTWANQETGASPEVWGRAMGWYMMALVDCLDYIPANHPDRKELITLLQNLSKNVLKYQDTKSNLWYQVMDKGDQPGNWIETSGSAMFTYAFAKGCKKGYLEKSYLTVSRRAFESLISNYTYLDEDGRLYFDQTVKVGTLNPKNSKGDFDYYINTERRINDYKGLGALLFAAMELE